MVRRYETRFLMGAVVSLSLVALSSLASPVFAQELIQNGDFETGTLANWTIQNQEFTDGFWLIQTGTTTPIYGNTVPAPPQGSFAAMTDQNAGGSRVLYQNFVVPTGISSATLSFQYSLQNLAADFVTPNSLDYLTMANQQARVDITTSTAGEFSMAESDVLLNIYRTEVGDQTITEYFSVSTDLTAFLQAHEGETLRLRFAEVDNQNLFHNGVDQVSLVVSTGSSVSAPEPATLALLLAGGGTIGLVRRRRVR